MIFMYKGEPVAECGIFGAVAGVRCDAITLEAKDLVQMYRIMQFGSTHQRNALAEFLTSLVCRFHPSCFKGENI